jgi:hypothetical protein
MGMLRIRCPIIAHLLRPSAKCAFPAAAGRASNKFRKYLNCLDLDRASIYRERRLHHKEAKSNRCRKDGTTVRASTPALEIKHIADEWRPSSRGATIDQAAKRLKVERGRDN